MRPGWTWTPAYGKKRAHAVERDTNRTACGRKLRGRLSLSGVTPRPEHACKRCYQIAVQKGAR